MKRLFLVLMGAVSFYCAQGQTVAKSMMVGGSINYQSTKDQYSADNDEVETNFSFVPSVGYFVIDRLAVGVNVGILRSTYQDPYDNPKIKSSGFLVGPFARYYKHTSNEKFAFFAQASLSISSYKQGALVDGNEVKSSSTSFAISPGFAYFFNDHWSAELMFRGIGYTSSDPNKDVDNNKVSTFDFGINSLSPSLGMRFYF